MAQGLTLIQSVEKNSNANIFWSVLALDEKAANFFNSLSKANVEVIEFAKFSDLDLRALVGQRPWREICWTSASCLLSHCIDQKLDVDFVGYIDADCYFFGDIQKMLIEIPREKSIAIHEHNFSSDRVEWLEKSGRFNVGVVIGRPDAQFSKCIKEWRRQVLSQCTVDFDAGLCGDQTYLNDWPSRYTAAVHVFVSRGVGVAPWNLNNYEITVRDKQVLVNGDQIYFFHFHGLQVYNYFGFLAFYVPASGYALIRTPVDCIYRPYVSEVLKATDFINFHVQELTSAVNFNWLVRNFLKRKLRFLVQKRVRKRYVRELKSLL